jgi:hypothetical protein
MSDWISVSEKFPAKDGKYLCTTDSGDIDVYGFSNDLYFIDHYDFAEYKGKHKEGFYAYDSEWGYSEADYIAAWMPLPLPYKEGEEE